MSTAQFNVSGRFWMPYGLVARNVLANTEADAIHQAKSYLEDGGHEVYIDKPDGYIIAINPVGVMRRACMDVPQVSILDI